MTRVDTDLAKALREQAAQLRSDPPPEAGQLEFYALICDALALLVDSSS